MDPENVFSGGPVSLAPGGPSPVGLGDVVARVTAFVGLHPCDDCRKRRHRLNRVKVWGRWGLAGSYRLHRGGPGGRCCPDAVIVLVVVFLIVVLAVLVF